MSQKYQLAQVNIARAKAPLDDPLMRGFVEQLEPINRLAENSPGFVWRLQTEEGDATAIKLFDDERIIVNMSVWETFEALKDYVYGGEHLALLRNKKSWMEKLDSPSLVLWWVPQGHIPSPESAKLALAALQENGPSPAAFIFTKPYPAPHPSDSPAASEQSFQSTAFEVD
ncbi:DUF3291 domain-containing protein [Pseudomonas sp. 2FE]|uniref:DUF3291 domain-containing protein n=1 Tax=Pseudomonas sp. 2FE TaxID=2502190 RepID=UPI0010F7891F|nr:DUF3291 domain-containing protein [Pseudomonas sp. 2FE]